MIAAIFMSICTWSELTCMRQRRIKWGQFSPMLEAILLLFCHVPHTWNYLWSRHKKLHCGWTQGKYQWKTWCKYRDRMFMQLCKLNEMEECFFHRVIFFHPSSLWLHHNKAQQDFCPKYIYIYIYIYILARKPAFGGLPCSGDSTTTTPRRGGNASVAHDGMCVVFIN